MTIFWEISFGSFSWRIFSWWHLHFQENPFYLKECSLHSALTSSTLLVFVLYILPSCDMTSKCIVPNCKSSSKAGEGISWHSFPKEEEVLQKWIKNIPRSDWTPSKWSHISSLHFAEDCFTQESQDTNIYRKKATVQKYRIKKGSVPTLFPGCALYLSN